MGFFMRFRRYYFWWLKVGFVICAILFLFLYITAPQHDIIKKHTDIPVNEKPLPFTRKIENNVVHREVFSRDIHGNEPLTKDWHDYIFIAYEKNREGNGEQGQAYFLSPKFEKEKHALFKANGFNGRASDDISINRSLSDIRHHKCKEKKYQEHLPTTSVIIPFYNEHWSTLLRTVMSVLNRSPAELLAEILLVDDGSSKPFLKEELDTYVRDHLPKVKVIRSPERKGLISARLEGAKVAVGQALVFLDSHTECATNWLPPLLSPIAKDYRTCVCPFIDVIDFENFAYRAQDEGARGGFDWQLFYKRLPLLEQDKANMPDPFKSPVMAGGLFAIDTRFFWELGGYDPGLQIWGGEQYELSFKIWQCGGIMLDAPCSRVGHIYRKFSPFTSANVGNYLQRNHKRVAEVWMDEYAEYVYKHTNYMRSVNPGDLTQQKALRTKLKCKPFKWFMTEVAFDLMKVYPPIEPPDFAHGIISNKLDPSLCVDTKYKGHEQRFGLDTCSNGGSQKFHLTWRRDIRPGKSALCWDVSSYEAQSPILLYHCHGAGGNQLWKYDYKNQLLIHGINYRCLDTNPGTMEIFVSNCDVNKISQKWIFEEFDEHLLDNWEKGWF